MQIIDKKSDGVLNLYKVCSEHEGPIIYYTILKD